MEHCGLAGRRPPRRSCALTSPPSGRTPQNQYLKNEQCYILHLYTRSILLHHHDNLCWPAPRPQIKEGQGRCSSTPQALVSTGVSYWGQWSHFACAVAPFEVAMPGTAENTPKFQTAQKQHRLLLWRRFRTERAQCAHSANYYGDYPGNSPENHPARESCTTNSNLENSNI